MPKSADVSTRRESWLPDWPGAVLFKIVLLTGTLLLSLGLAAGAIGATDGGTALIYHVPALHGGMNLGIVLICASVTLYLLLDGVPKTFSVLREVFLPGGPGDAVSREGEGGAVRWSSDKEFQGVLRYLCVRTAEYGLRVMEHAKFICECAKGNALQMLFSGPMAESGGRKAVGNAQAAAVNGGRQAVKGNAEGESVKNEKGIALLPPCVPKEKKSVYTVGCKFSVENNFGRLVTFGKKVGDWDVPPFTRFVLKVLLTDGRDGGLTSEMIHAAAKKLFLMAFPEVVGTEKGIGSGVVAVRPLRQYFRISGKNGRKVTHPFFKQITKTAARTPSYFINKESVKVKVISD